MGTFGKEEKPSHLKFGKRHVLMIWLFMGFGNSYILRVCINTAIVSMIKSNETESAITGNGTNFNKTLPDDVCPFPESNHDKNNNSTKPEGEFAWDKNTQGIVLSAFYYGYIATQFIGGYLPRIIGGRLLFGISVGGVSALTLIHPVAARSSIEFLIVLRVLVGFFQGVIFPCNSYLCANWVPKQERSTLGTLPATGTFIGTVIAAALTGVLCEYGFDGGWPTAFYVWGALGLLWTAGWFWVVSDTPDNHPTISNEERAYIVANCQSQSKPVPFSEIPWKSLFSSPAVWAIVFAQTGYTWNYYTLLTEMSTYLKDVLHISASLNGVITSIPYVVMLVLSLAAAFLADILRSKGMSTKWVRRVTYALGMVGSSVFLIIVGYAGCNSAAVIILITIAIGLVGLGYAGYIVNYMDVAPQYASIIMGITNTFGTLSGIISPIVASALVNERSTIATWQIVFYISAGVSTFMAIMYFFLAQGEVQKWALVAPQGGTAAEPSKDDNKNKLQQQQELSHFNGGFSLQPEISAGHRTDYF